MARRPVHALLLISVLAAQTLEEPTIRVTVTNVLLDVTVTGRNQQPLTGLGAADFQVFQDGRPRPVLSATLVTLPRRAGGGRPTAPETPSEPAIAPVRRTDRTIALVVDDLGLSLQSMHAVRESIRRFVEQQTQPGDRVAIVRTSGGIAALQQFTSDRSLLRVAAARLRFNPASRVHLENTLQATSDTLRTAEQRAEDQFRENSLVGALGTLNMLVQRLSNAPGRKSVVLFTDSLPILEKSHRPRIGRNMEGEDLYDYTNNPRVRGAIQKLTDGAARSGVAIHTVDAKGLLTSGVDMAAAGQSSNPAALRAAANTREIRLANALDGLRLVARETGGTFTTNNNDLNDALVRSLDADASYYLLAYEPDPAIFRNGTNAEAFHRLKVTVNRPGASVRHRSGFYGRADSPASAAEPAPTVNFSLTPAFFQMPDGPVIDARLLIDAADLTFVDEPGGLRKTVIETNIVTLNEQGLPASQLGQDYTMRVTPEQLEEIRRLGLVYRVRHPVKKPGAYLVRAFVTDKQSRRSGSATHFIEVPDIGNKSLILSNLTIGRAGETGGTLRPGDALEYGAQLINSTSRQLRRELRLYCEGELTGHIPAGPFETIAVENIGYPVAAGRIQLNPNAAAGNYTLEITVTDSSMPKGKGSATQFASFLVAPRQ